MGKAREKGQIEAEPREGQSLLPDERAPTRGEGRGFARSYLVRSLEVFMYWMPVWVPLILLAQIGTRGLAPAQEEEQRLIEHERVLLDRLEADEARARELGDWFESLNDPIYRERLRRLSQEEMRREIEERGLSAPTPEERTD